MSPTLTSWGYNEATGRFDNIERIEGTLQVVLEDGQGLSGTFSAEACLRHP